MTVPQSPGGPGDRTNRPHPRGNGLAAEHFVPLVDVDPRIAVPLLEVLRRAGIAAYAAPTPGEVGGYLDVHLPDRPTDRLWVDGTLRERAGEIVRGELASQQDRPAVGGEAADPDGVDPFDEIVAGFNRSWTSGEETPWPSIEDIPPGESTTALPPSRVVRFSALDRPAEEAESLPRHVEDYLDEHYVPAPPPPLPRPAVATFWAIVGLVGGLVVLVGSSLLHWDLDPIFVAAAAFALLGGFATLVWRMRESSDDDDPDDGAVV